MVQVEVMVDHSQHVFIVERPSVLELPVVGNSITCGVCGKKNGTIVKVGVPSRAERKTAPPMSIDKNQKNLLEE